MYATEIATFRCKAPLSSDELTATHLSKTSELLHRQKGMHGCHYGAAAEDPLETVYMMYWADIPTHEVFHHDEAQFGELLGLLGPILEGPPGVRHYFFPSDEDLREVLKTGRVEMRSFFFAKEDKGFGERLEEVARTGRGVEGVKGAGWAWAYEEVEHEKLAAPGKVVASRSSQSPGRPT